MHFISRKISVVIDSINGWLFDGLKTFNAWSIYFLSFQILLTFSFQVLPGKRLGRTQSWMAREASTFSRSTCFVMALKLSHFLPNGEVQLLGRNYLYYCLVYCYSIASLDCTRYIYHITPTLQALFLGTTSFSHWCFPWPYYSLQYSLPSLPSSCHGLSGYSLVLLLPIPY